MAVCPNGVNLQPVHASIEGIITSIFRLGHFYGPTMRFSVQLHTNAATYVPQVTIDSLATYSPAPTHIEMLRTMAFLNSASQIRQ